MAAEKKAAVGRIVMASREHPVLVEPLGAGLVMFLLRSADEVRAAEYDFPEIKIDRKMVEIAGTIMERQAGKFEPAEFRDRYQEALRELIMAKAKGVSLEKRRSQEPSNVVDLMAALKRSLDGGKPSAAEKPARKKKAGKSDQRQGNMLLPLAGGKTKKPEVATARRRRA